MEDNKNNSEDKEQKTKVKTPKRSRDVGRKYQSGYSKKAQKGKENKMISELPKLSNWFKNDISTGNLSVGNDGGDLTSAEPSIGKNDEDELSFTQATCNQNQNEESTLATLAEKSSGSEDGDTSVSCELPHEQALVACHDDEDDSSASDDNSDDDNNFNKLSLDDVVPTFVDDLDDLGLWPKMNEDSISYWLRKGSSECRHSNGCTMQGSCSSLYEISFHTVYLGSAFPKPQGTVSYAN